MDAKNIVNISYAQTGQSSTTNSLGMREMQAMAYEARNKKYLLIKAPPASGKSRALMFVALDKLVNQGIRITTSTMVRMWSTSVRYWTQGRRPSYTYPA